MEREIQSKSEPFLIMSSVLGFSILAWISLMPIYLTLSSLCMESYCHASVRHVHTIVFHINVLSLIHLWFISQKYIKCNDRLQNTVGLVTTVKAIFWSVYIVKLIPVHYRTSNFGEKLINYNKIQYKKCPQIELTQVVSTLLLISYAEIQESSILIVLPFKNGHEITIMLKKMGIFSEL